MKVDTKMIDRIKTFLLFMLIGCCIGLPLIMIPISISHDYLFKGPVQVTILDKMIQDGGKYGKYLYLIMMENSTGIEFETLVGPHEYMRSQIGDIKIYKLSKSDIRQTLFGNIMLLLMVFGLSVLVATPIAYIFHEIYYG